MKTVILASPNQYGYFTIYFNYAKYLSKSYSVVYICFDQGEVKIREQGNIRVFYISKKGSKILRTLKYYMAIFRIYKSIPSSRVILKYYFFSSLLNALINRKDLILDIRTGYTSESEFITAFYNSIIRFESLFFKRIVTLSESLRKKLRLQINKTTIIPLGAEKIYLPAKTFNKILLLYVGTISSRNIDQTVIGLSQYLNGSDVEKEIEYFIIGGGKESDVLKLNSTIINSGLEKIIHYIGPVYGENLNHYFGICNIGVSYIPITKDYDCQPPTKTIEYLMAGMPVIATATSENSKMISSSNGFLINDSPASFAEGLKKICNSGETFSSKAIIESVKDYSYETILETKLLPLLCSK